MKRVLIILSFAFLSIHTFAQNQSETILLVYSAMENNPAKAEGDKTVKSDSTKNKKEEIGKVWTLGVEAGYSFRIAPISKNFEGDILSYKRGLKHGYNLGISTHYFLSKNFGLGCKYGMFNTSNSAHDLSYTYLKEEYKYDYRQDNISLHYIGPSISLRTSGTNKKMYTNFDFSIGYIQYVNQVDLDDDSYELKKGNLSFSTTIGTDFMLSNSMSLGLNLNISAASIKSEKFIHPENENFSRLSLGMIVKYHK